MTKKLLRLSFLCGVLCCENTSLGLDSVYIKLKDVISSDTGGEVFNEEEKNEFFKEIENIQKQPFFNKSAFLDCPHDDSLLLSIKFSNMNEVCDENIIKEYKCNKILCALQKLGIEHEVVRFYQKNAIYQCNINIYKDTRTYGSNYILYLKQYFNEDIKIVSTSCRKISSQEEAELEKAMEIYLKTPNAKKIK